MLRKWTITMLGVALLLAAVLYVPAVTADKGFSEDFVDRCLAVARDVDPDLASQLVVIRADKGEAEFAMALRNARHLVHLTRIQEEDPNLYDVKVRSLRADAHASRLVEQIVVARQAGDYETFRRLEAELDELAADLVALDLAARGMYVIKLRAHLDRLKDQLNQEGDNFFQTVQRRRQQLQDQVDELSDEAP